MVGQWVFGTRSDHVIVQISIYSYFWAPVQTGPHFFTWGWVITLALPYLVSPHIGVLYEADHSQRWSNCFSLQRTCRYLINLILYYLIPLQHMCFRGVAFTGKLQFCHKSVLFTHSLLCKQHNWSHTFISTFINGFITTKVLLFPRLYHESRLEKRKAILQVCQGSNLISCQL